MKKGHKTRAAPAANKELFKKCVEDTEEKVIHFDFWYLRAQSKMCWHANITVLLACPCR